MMRLIKQPQADAPLQCKRQQSSLLSSVRAVGEDPTSCFHGSPRHNNPQVVALERCTQPKRLPANDHQKAPDAHLSKMHHQQQSCLPQAQQYLAMSMTADNSCEAENMSPGSPSSRDADNEMLTMAYQPCEQQTNSEVASECMLQECDVVDTLASYKRSRAPKTCKRQHVWCNKRFRRDGVMDLWSRAGLQPQPGMQKSIHRDC